MLRLALIQLLITNLCYAFWSDCMAEYEPFVNGECMRLKTSPTALTYNQAFQLCAADGARPVKIESEHDDVRIARAARIRGGQEGPVRFWIGLECMLMRIDEPAVNAIENLSHRPLYHWDNGRILDVMGEYSNFKVPFNCSRSTAYTRFFHDGSGWVPAKDEMASDIRAVLCMQFPKTPCGTYHAFEQPDAPEVEPECWSPVRTASNWLSANATCSAEFGSMAKAPLEYLSELAAQDNITSGVHVGIHTPIDGTYDGEGFAPGFPNPSAHGECVGMATAGHWRGSLMNVDCESVALPFYCTRKPFSDAPPIADEESECPMELFGEGATIESPRFNGTENSCDYLVAVERNNIAQVEIHRFEANVCCDSLVIRDGLFGDDVIARLTGNVARFSVYSATTNSMRIEWKTEESRGTSGFLLTVRSISDVVVERNACSSPEDSR